MSRMIRTAGNFQYSVNIAYDLENSDKLKGFIPTKSSLDLLEEILSSTQSFSSSRARILIGAYGKGKSHIILTILSILKRHEPRTDFIHLNEKMAENPRLNQMVQNYYDSGKKLLPVLITGNGTSLSQSFLISLKNTLSESGLSDFMPKTNYKAAISTIKKWKKEYPDTLKKFEELAGAKTDDYISELEDFSVETYRNFESLYPSLTAGSEFNPFLGFDVPLLYETVAKELHEQKLYDGLYVVYDEFSKYLEANIESASVSDTKMLQDFAEKATRSGENQLHLLLISHREIANYIDRLPKQKTDGWRGISERFKHILLNNNFSQVYEIISTVIQKDKKAWQTYLKKHDENFSLLEKKYQNHELFRDVKEKVADLIKQTFPLHPVSTFILPRLSERVAQNERTLFTFLSANTDATLPSFLKSFNDSKFELVTPDLIFDYFEPLLKKEIYSGELHEIYHLTSVILDKLKGSGDGKNELEMKIVKTISLIYILSQFEKLKPVTEEIVRIYGYSYSREQIENSIKNLIENEFVIYLRQSNSYLKLKETSGIDIIKSIHDEIERQKKSFVLHEVLNSNNGEHYFYPYRYNDQKEMTRFFEFTFIDFESFKSSDSALTSPDLTHRRDTQKDGKSINYPDGKIIAVICKSREDTDYANELIKKKSRNNKYCIFALLKKNVKIEKNAAELNAIIELIKKNDGDEILSSEYQVVLDDVSEVISDYIKKYTHPENNFCLYFWNGKKIDIYRRSELSEKLSDICDECFSKSPIINNEAINKNNITQMAHNSRRKIIAGLLRNSLEKNLGLTGSGQDVAIMRSTLLHVGLLVQEDDKDSDCASLNMDFSEDLYNLRPMIDEIRNFVDKAQNEKKCFSDLYDKLTSPKHEIAMRLGIIPIYVALIFGRIKNQLVLYHGNRQVQINADILAQINEAPEEFFAIRFSMDEGKKKYLSLLKNLFEASDESAEGIAFAIQNWYLALPKYSRTTKSTYSSFLNILKDDLGAQELLFTKIPNALGKYNCYEETARETEKAKLFYDNLIYELKEDISKHLKKIFKRDDFFNWIYGLPENIFNRIFDDGTERFLKAFRNADENPENFIRKLAFIATGLELEDWNDGTEEIFLERIHAWKKSAESFNADKSNFSSDSSNTILSIDGKTYSVSFPISKGKCIVRNFEKVSESERAKLLYNKLSDALDTMGKSMSEAEKRQVLMDVLQKMCGGEN